MVIKDGDRPIGIKCNLCKISYINVFNYYNAKFQELSINVIMGKTQKKSTYELDFCELCVDKIKSDFLGRKKNYQIFEGGIMIGMYCNKCDQLLKMIYDCFNVSFDFVEVDSNRQKRGPLKVDLDVLTFDFCNSCVRMMNDGGNIT